MSPDFAATLCRVALVMASARDRWWVIGSAAAALHGVPVRVDRDVDVLVATADIPAIAAAAGGVARPGVPDTRFRSDWLMALPADPLAIEIFAGLALRGLGGWAPVRLRTRVAVRVAGETLYVPERAELAVLFDRFDRPKDRVRARLLRASG